MSAQATITHAALPAVFVVVSDVVANADHAGFEMLSENGHRTLNRTLFKDPKVAAKITTQGASPGPYERDQAEWDQRAGGAPRYRHLGGGQYEPVDA